MRSLVLKQYVVDAFTDKVFSGNPAAVCVLEQWLPEARSTCAATPPWPALLY